MVSVDYSYTFDYRYYQEDPSPKRGFTLFKSCSLA